MEDQSFGRGLPGVSVQLAALQRERRLFRQTLEQLDLVSQEQGAALKERREEPVVPPVSAQRTDNDTPSATETRRQLC